MNRQPRVKFLYEDEDIIAVDKPEGLPTIAPEGSRARSLYDIVTDHIRRRNPKGRAAVVHRLDRDTSGIMVFAKNASAKTRLMGSWNDLVAERRYVAVVDGHLPRTEGTLDSWLTEVGLGQVKESPYPSKGALRALTHYRVLATGQLHSLVELKLETGRKHQIRVQLSGVGCPISGDAKYGSRTDPLGRLCLHATVIELMANPAKPSLRFESPMPAVFAKAVSSPAPKARGLAGPGIAAPEKAWRGRKPRGDSRLTGLREPKSRGKTRPENHRFRNQGGLPEARPGGRADPKGPENRPDTGD